MKIIDSKVIRAIKSLRVELNSNAEVGRRLGFTGKHVGKILEGKVNYLEAPTWERVEPILRPYLLEQEQEDKFIKSRAQDQGEALSWDSVIGDNREKILKAGMYMEIFSLWEVLSPLQRAKIFTAMAEMACQNDKKTNQAEDNSKNSS